VTLPRHIVAIGGGGFLMDDTSGLQERYLLSLCASTRFNSAARVLYIGTALGDAAHAQVKFFRMFASLDCKVDALPFFPYEMKRDYAASVCDADLIYVGGGNTPAMLAVWRAFGFDDMLRAAYQAGTVLAGISAGANCWFQHYVTDSVPGGGVREGLGWLAGTFCPHLDSQTWREPMLAAQPGPSLGAGEHVLVHYENEQWHEAVTSKNTTPQCVRKPATDAPTEAVHARSLG
jgi:dipeptidase E